MGTLPIPASFASGASSWCGIHPSLELVEVPPDVEPVGGDHVGLALDQELRLLPRDVRHRREDVRKMRAGSLDAVPAKSPANYSTLHNVMLGEKKNNKITHKRLFPTRKKNPMYNLEMK